MEESKEMGRRLQEARKRAGYSRQGKLAELIGTSSTTVSRWENGESPPEAITLTLLAWLYGTTVGWLKGEDGVEEKPDRLLVVVTPEEWEHLLIYRTVGDGREAADEVLRALLARPKAQAQ